MDNLDFVKPIINDNINYREDQKELIKKAMEISYGNPLNALQTTLAFSLTSPSDSDST